MLYHTTADRQKLVTWIDVSLAEIGLEVIRTCSALSPKTELISANCCNHKKRSSGNTAKYN